MGGGMLSVRREVAAEAGPPPASYTHHPPRPSAPSVDFAPRNVSPVSAAPRCRPGLRALPAPPPESWERCRHGTERERRHPTPPPPPPRPRPVPVPVPLPAGTARSAAGPARRPARGTGTGTQTAAVAGGGNSIAPSPRGYQLLPGPFPLPPCAEHRGGLGSGVREAAAAAADPGGLRAPSRGGGSGDAGPAAPLPPCGGARLPLVLSAVCPGHSSPPRCGWGKRSQLRLVPVVRQSAEIPPLAFLVGLRGERKLQ